MRGGAAAQAQAQAQPTYHQTLISAGDVKALKAAIAADDRCVGAAWSSMAGGARVGVGQGCLWPFL